MLARHLLRPLWYFVLLFFVAVTPTTPAIAQDAGPYDTLSCERRIEFWVTEVGLPPTRAANDVVAAPYLDRECKAGLESSCPCVRGLAQRGKTPEAGEALVRSELDPLCTGGDGWACGRLSRLVGWYSVDPEVELRSVAEMERGCTVGFAPACAIASGMRLRRAKTADDYKLGVDLIVRACDLARNDPTPCAMAAAAIGNPTRTITEPDHPRATGFLLLACERGDAPSCRRAGRAFEFGRWIGLDLGLARAMRERGCDLGDVKACTDLSQMLYAGKGGPRDRDRAARLALAGCDQNDMHACMSLGGMYYYGHGVPKDRTRAFRLAVRSCDGGSRWGCSNAASALRDGEGVAASAANARYYHQRACSLGATAACDEITDDEVPADERTMPPSKPTRKTSVGRAPKSR